MQNEQASQLQSLDQYRKAIDRLHEQGFITELWIDYKTQHVTFRWVRKGAKWHITSYGLNHLNADLNHMGRQAIRWLNARASGSANEANFAVPEI